MQHKPKLNNILRQCYVDNRKEQTIQSHNRRMHKMLTKDIKYTGKPQIHPIKKIRIILDP